MKILLVEDEPDLSEVVSAYLEHNGYNVEVAANGREAVDKAFDNAYDAILMDIMMPVMDGIEALGEIRKSGNITPILLLTAKTEVEDRIRGLDAGADDYLTKPFAMGELLARVRSMTRRNSDYHSDVLILEDVKFDTKTGTLSSKNSIRLASKEAMMMELFMHNPGKGFARTEIYDHVWKDEDEDIEIVDMYISFLQGKLKSIGAKLVIETDESDKYMIHLQG